MKADGVFSGGGVKGLAFAGAVKGAAEAGYTEWGKLAGTSAGAIAAMALAVGYDANGLQEIFENSTSRDRRLLARRSGDPDQPRQPRRDRGVALHDWIVELLRTRR